MRKELTGHEHDVYDSDNQKPFSDTDTWISDVELRCIGRSHRRETAAIESINVISSLACYEIRFESGLPRTAA